MADPEKIKVTVLLEHYAGDEMWTASVPLIPGCLAEGPTLEEASEAILPEIEEFVQAEPVLLARIKEQPEFFITQVAVNVP